MISFIASALFWTEVIESSSQITSTPAPTRTQYVQIVPKETILIFAPHPDDEILCCSDVIQEKKTQGNKIKIIFVTDGDALSAENPQKSRNYARARRKESWLAAKELGLRRSDLMFLGFPDGMLDKLVDRAPTTSPFSKRNKTAANTFHAGAPYTRDALKSSLSQILTKYNPSEIFVPSVLDVHPDHQTVGEILEEVVMEAKHPTQTFSYLVHNKKPLAPNYNNINANKFHLIAFFQTQFHDAWHQKFLEYFAFIPERFFDGTGALRVASE